MKVNESNFNLSNLFYRKAFKIISITNLINTRTKIARRDWFSTQASGDFQNWEGTLIVKIKPGGTIG